MLHTVEYKPLRSNGWVDLPPGLKNKKAIINMKNDDNECFKWCITRVLNPVKKNSERVTSLLREQSEALNWGGIEFPVKVCNTDTVGGSSDVDGFERMNPEVDSPTAGGGTVNLLLFSTADGQHYCIIKDISRLLSSQISKNEHKNFFCLRCINHFGSQKLLDSHKEYCGVLWKERSCNDSYA